MVQSRVDEIARDFDVDWAPVPHESGECTVHFTLGGRWIVEGHRGHGHALKDLPLRRKIPHHVVHVWHAYAFRKSGGPGQKDDRRTFGVGTGDGIDAVQPAHTVGDAGGADAVDPCIGIGSESCAILTSRPDVADGRAFNELVQAEDVVPGDAENVAHAQLIQPIDHGRPDCRVVLHCLDARSIWLPVDRCPVPANHSGRDPSSIDTTECIREVTDLTFGHLHRITTAWPPSRIRQKALSPWRAPKKSRAPVTCGFMPALFMPSAGSRLAGTSSMSSCRMGASMRAASTI